MTDLTAIVLTKNEELNIRDCLASIQPLAKRIVVVDSFSADRTAEIAKEFGADVYQHEFVNYSKQFLYGLNETGIDTKWIFRIDADERLTEASRAEIESLCELNMDTDVNGIILRFEVTFLGKKLRHGGIYPFRKLLVFKRGIGTIEDRYMDEHIVLAEGRTVEVKNDSEHHDFKDLAYFIQKHNWYSSREVLDYIENTKLQHEDGRELNHKAGVKRWIKFHIYYKLPMGMRAHLYYWYRYYIKLGFLDGKEGKIYAFMQAYWYRYLVDAKIYEYQKSGNVNRNPKL